jgi:hypothetical protein
MSDPSPGDIVRMSSFTHVDGLCRWGFRVADKRKVSVFMLLGEENKDGTEPLDLEKQLNELGWFQDGSPK